MKVVQLIEIREWKNEVAQEKPKVPVQADGGDDLRLYAGSELCCRQNSIFQAQQKMEVIGEMG